MANTQLSTGKPRSYADLTLVQLKTFADRGDERAQHELARRLGASVDEVARPAAVQRAVPPVRAVSRPAPAMPPETTPRVQAPPVDAHRMTPPLRPNGFADTQAVDLDERAAGPGAMLARGVADTAYDDAGQLPMGRGMALDLPAGGDSRFSPELIARLNAIGARDDDEEREAAGVILLGAIMGALGLLVTLFGFKMVGGAHGTWFYVLGGLGTLAAGVLYVKRNKLAPLVYGLTLVMILAWAFSVAKGSMLDWFILVFVPVGLACVAFHPRLREPLN